MDIKSHTDIKIPSMSPVQMYSSTMLCLARLGAL